MKAAPLDSRPSFKLMKQNDVVNFFHLQMPRWLFSHQKYKSLSLEAKVCYTFLLNRFQLSRLNGWVNLDGEVFIIFTREALAEEMQISYKKAISCFRELVAVGLIWEKRVGRGDANQIYLALVEMPERDAAAHNAAPFGNEGARPTKTEHLNKTEAHEKADENRSLDLPNQHIKNGCMGSSASAKIAHPDMPDLQANKKERRENDKIELDKVRPSVTHEPVNTNETDEIEELNHLLGKSELWVLPETEQDVFANAMERLYFTKELKVGGAVLPQERVRRHLHKIGGTVLLLAYEKLRANTTAKIKNSTAYVMATLFNCIFEEQSDLLVDPYLNSLGRSDAAGGG